MNCLKGDLLKGKIAALPHGLSGVKREPAFLSSL